MCITSEKQVNLDTTTILINSIFHSDNVTEYAYSNGNNDMYVTDTYLMHSRKFNICNIVLKYLNNPFKFLNLNKFHLCHKY